MPIAMPHGPNADATDITPCLSDIWPFSIWLTAPSNASAAWPALPNAADCFAVACVARCTAASNAVNREAVASVATDIFDCAEPSSFAFASARPRLLSSFARSATAAAVLASTSIETTVLAPGSAI